MKGSNGISTNDRSTLTLRDVLWQRYNCARQVRTRLKYQHMSLTPEISATIPLHDIIIDTDKGYNYSTQKHDNYNVYFLQDFYVWSFLKSD